MPLLSPPTSSQLVPRPNSRIADKYVQKSVCVTSACIAWLWSSVPTPGLVAKEVGITISEAMVIQFPELNERIVRVDRRLHRNHGDVGCQQVETTADDAERYSFCFYSLVGMVKMHPPKGSRSRSNFDETVNPKAHHRNTSGGQPRSDRHERFESVPNNCEGLKPLAPFGPAPVFIRCSAQKWTRLLFWSLRELRLVGACTRLDSP